VEADPPLGRLRLEIRCRVANLQSHGFFLLVDQDVPSPEA
jgi:hypothetical protein